MLSHVDVDHRRPARIKFKAEGFSEKAMIRAIELSLGSPQQFCCTVIMLVTDEERC